MVRILWGRATSYNVQKVAWVLEEIGLEYKQVELGGPHGGLDSEDYRALNPNKRVPTLQDGDAVLWESNAICRYLVANYNSPFSLSDPAAHAKADMWMDWYQGGSYAPFISVFFQTVRLPASQRETAKLTSGLAKLRAQYWIAEKALATSEYLGGDQISIADIPFGASLFRFFRFPVVRADWPRISAYYDRLQEREAYRKAVMVDYSSLAAGE